MEYPLQKELQAALGLLLELDDAPDLETFAERAVTGLRRVIPADLAGYNELDLERNETFVLVDPAEARIANVEEVLARHMRDNPLVVHFEHVRGDGPRRLSEFITRRDLHRRPLYAELFRQLGIEYQMVANVPTSRRLIGFVLNRTHRDFSERELVLLDLLRPHLIRAYENARARVALASLEAAADENGRSLVVLGRSGRIEYTTPRGRDLLRALGAPRGGADVLPPDLEEWRQGPAAHGVFHSELDGRRIYAQQLSSADRIIVLAEQNGAPSADSLARLGLSPRERDVLALAATGMTNPEIATSLEISRRTVKKHLERIYEKLDVHTRTAAVAVALTN